MSIRKNICQIRGKDSRNLLCWRKSLQKDTCGPGGDWQRFKRLQDQIMRGQKYRRKLVKPLRIEKNRNGQEKNQGSTMFEDSEEFTLSILTTKNTKKLSKLRGEIWKDPWHKPCFVKELRMASRTCLHNRRLHPRRLQERVKSHESTRQRVDYSLLTKREDRIAGKGFMTIWFKILFLSFKHWRFLTKNTEILKNTRGENRKDQWHHPCRVKCQEEFQNSVWLYGGISRIHKATSGIFSTTKSWRPHCGQRFYFDVALQLGTQVYSDATSG